MIRKARFEDLTIIFDLVVELATSFKVNRERFENQWKEILVSPDATVLVSVEKGKVIGYLLGFKHPTFHANGPVAWVEEMVITKEYRFKRFGSILISEFENQMKSVGCTFVALASRKAGEFYKKINYEDSAVFYRKILKIDDKLLK